MIRAKTNCVFRYNLTLMRCLLPILILFTCPLAAAGADLVVKLPAGCEVKSATARSNQTKQPSSGLIDPESHTVTFEKLLPEVSYDLALTLKDNTALQGVSLDWYGLEAPKPDVAPLSDDDRKAISDLIRDPKAFENKQNILFIDGNNTRATVLVELIRDKDFHASGGNIIWRIELWYFENQFGGWAKVVQQNKVLRRERFKDQAAFDAATSKIKWVPQLGGIKLAKDKPTSEIVLPAKALSPGEK